MMRVHMYPPRLLPFARLGTGVRGVISALRFECGGVTSPRIQGLRE